MFSKVSCFLGHALSLLADRVKSTQSEFANDIIVSRQIFHRYCSQQQCSISSFLLWFLLFFSFLQFLLLFVYMCVFFSKQKIYILIYIRLCGRANDKKFFTRPISGNKTTFFGLKTAVYREKLFCLHKSISGVTVRNLLMKSGPFLFHVGFSFQQTSRWKMCEFANTFAFFNKGNYNPGQNKSFGNS